MLAQARLLRLRLAPINDALSRFAPVRSAPVRPALSRLKYCRLAFMNCVVPVKSHRPVAGVFVRSQVRFTPFMPVGGIR